MQLNLKLRVLRVAKILVRPGSEGTIYSCYFECISVMCPVTFPITFHFSLQPGYLGWFSVGTSVGSIQDFIFLKICWSNLVPRFQLSEAGPGLVHALRPNSISDF